MFKLSTLRFCWVAVNFSLSIRTTHWDVYYMEIIFRMKLSVIIIIGVPSNKNTLPITFSLSMFLKVQTFMGAINQFDCSIVYWLFIQIKWFRLNCDPNQLTIIQRLKTERSAYKSLVSEAQKPAKYNLLTLHSCMHMHIYMLRRQYICIDGMRCVHIATFTLHRNMLIDCRKSIDTWFLTKMRSL